MGKKIVLGITASIAAFKACDLIGLLNKSGYSVRCALSRDAEWFVAPLVLETLTGQNVVKDMFNPDINKSPIHISLADEADLILVAPATCDVICKVAAGICDDILLCTICSTDKPVIFVPAMNDKMFTNPIVQDKITYLKKKGYRFIDPVKGHLACGREAVGHLAPLEEIVKEVNRVLSA